jgi:hypothetical protein
LHDNDRLVAITIAFLILLGAVQAAASSGNSQTTSTSIRLRSNPVLPHEDCLISLAKTDGKTTVLNRCAFAVQAYVACQSAQPGGDDVYHSCYLRSGPTGAFSFAAHCTPYFSTRYIQPAPSIYNSCSEFNIEHEAMRQSLDSEQREFLPKPEL